ISGTHFYRRIDLRPDRAAPLALASYEIGRIGGVSGEQRGLDGEAGAAVLHGSNAESIAGLLGSRGQIGFADPVPLARAAENQRNAILRIDDVVRESESADLMADIVGRRAGDIGDPRSSRLQTSRGEEARAVG